MLFDRWAGYYDELYRAKGKDFAREAEKILAISLPGGSRLPRPALLDAACGTGEHLRCFSRACRVAGLDRSPAMLRAARAKVPGADLVCGDMRTFELDARFDVVTCLFGSVGYLPGAGDLERAVSRLASHLRPGGVLVIEPPPLPEALAPPERQELEAPVRGGVMRRVASATYAPPVLRVRFEFELRTGDACETFVETHPVRIFTRAELDTALGAAGLEPDWREGFVIGRVSSR